ncbi:hypothetical protein Sango_3069400 [Sesamum angolense]|uniref:Reverse transcriptase domain-containing protein n=1 Tax=Sesamum angolense TaxID=2727404 RepID=A0AAE1VZE6_9LAMI|nr:hypothetical protein Sango_3069400 [Sesamum angolense]
MAEVSVNLPELLRQQIVSTAEGVVGGSSDIISTMSESVAAGQHTGSAEVLNGDSDAMASLNSLKDRWEQKFKTSKNPALKSVIGRPSTPFRPRVSLLPRRCVRTGTDSLPDLVTCPVPRSGNRRPRITGQRDPVVMLKKLSLKKLRFHKFFASPPVAAGDLIGSELTDCRAEDVHTQDPNLALNPPATVQESDIYIGNVKLQAEFVDTIAGAFLQSSRKTLHFVPPTRQNGEVIIRPTKEVIDNGSKKCGQRRRLDMEDVIEGGPWLFQGQPILLQPWEQGMSLRRQNILRFRFGSDSDTCRWNIGQTKALARLQAVSALPYTLTVSPRTAPDSTLPGSTDYDFCSKQPPRKDLTPPELKLTEGPRPAPSSGLASVSEQSTVPQLAARWCTNSGSAGLDKGKDIVLHNSYSALDTELTKEAEGIQNEPWLILGDFNAVMDDSEVCGQAADTSASMMEFRSCIRDTVNGAWLDVWPGSSYVSALPSTSDHSPLILTGTNRVAENVVFRFDNYLAQLPGFLGLVENIWKHHIPGTAMYEIVCKLKLLKAEFRRQKKRTGDLTANVRKAKDFLDKAQSLFTIHKEDIFLNLVKCCRRVYSAAVKLEISMLQQRAKLRWLKHGDQNSKVFFRKINSTRVKQRVFQITNINGDSHKSARDVESAPGPDGFGSAFYRAAWPVIGQSMVEAVGEFFRTASFSVSLNGSIHGFFKGGRGLRQGDPISPYLFVLVMEIGSALLRYRIHNAPNFQYHWKCKDLGIINLCFADDVLLFCKADIPSIKILTDTLSEFATFSGLKVNPAKSQIILSRAVQQQRQQLLDCVGFQEGSLPIKYLGVLKMLERKMRTFLWQGPSGEGQAKVAWDQICKPKAEGGLGLRSLIIMNQALILKQLWRILQNDGSSIWVDWIQQNRLRHSTIWTFNRSTGSWCWKKMLKLRPILQRGVHYKVGDGSSFSLWQDPWHERGPLCLSFPRGIEVTGLPLSSTLSSVLQRNQWCWPAATDSDIVEIISLLPPTPSAVDTICWRSNSGKFTLTSAILLIQPPSPHAHWQGLLQGNYKLVKLVSKHS